MKKFLLFACSFASLSAAAQQERLVSLITDDNQEADYFTWTEHNQVAVRKHVEEWWDGMNYEDRCYYNDLGQLVREDSYQDLGDPDNLAFVCMLEYTYNEQGLVATRDNYNSWDYGKTLDHSAHMTYEYDAEGRLLKETTYWAYNQEDPFMVVEYEYNDLGQLFRSVEYQEDMYYGTFPCIGYMEYTYNAKGKMTSANYYGMDTSGKAAMNSIQLYSWLGDDLVKLEDRDAYNAVLSRLEFTYDTEVPAEEALIPQTHEFKVDGHFGIAHKRTMVSVNMQNDQGVLVHSHNLIYNYETNPTNGIAALQAQQPRLSYDANSRCLRVEALGMTDVTVINTAGQQVLSSRTAGQTLDLSTLPTGAYIVSARTAGHPTTCTKILVK